MTNSGALAEQLAAEYLQRQGLRLVETNFRCRLGEIDLILQDRDTLVFAEVRLRKSRSFGGAAASITPQKQTRLVRAAHHYLGSRSSLPPCRFDVVLLGALDGSDIEWIRDAFGT